MKKLTAGLKNKATTIPHAQYVGLIAVRERMLKFYSDKIAQYQPALALDVKLVIDGINS